VPEEQANENAVTPVTKEYEVCSPPIKILRSRTTYETKSTNQNSNGKRTLRLIKGDIIEEHTMQSNQSQEEFKIQPKLIIQ
jgi:sucrose-6-phosphate hydrolase SacC (GH32 family)